MIMIQVFSKPNIRQLILKENHYSVNAAYQYSFFHITNYNIRNKQLPIPKIVRTQVRSKLITII